MKDNVLPIADIAMTTGRPIKFIHAKTFESRDFVLSSVSVIVSFPVVSFPITVDMMRLTVVLILSCSELDMIFRK